jgi:cell division protein FtsW
MAKNKPDYIFLGISLALIILGILILASVSASLGQEKFGDVYYFLRRQLLFGLIPGIILGILAFKVPLAWFKKWALPLLLLNLLFLALVFLPKIGLTSGGATRWINLGFFTFQPAEFFKLAFFIYLAAWLTSREKKYKSLAETLIPFLVIVGLAVYLLYLQPNVSNLGIIGITATIIYFGAGTPIWQTILMTSTAIAGLIFLIQTAPYRLHRFLVFLHPETEPMGIGYQIKQALIAVGSGGILGLGLGMSRQKFGFLPQPIGDAIFAVFAEETGFLGTLILIFLFLIFAWRGFKIIKGAPDKFSSLLSLGIISWLLLQTFVNIGSMIGILPLTGIPLPFISYGGSHLIAELMGLGLLLNISKASNKA